MSALVAGAADTAVETTPKASKAAVAKAVRRKRSGDVDFTE
jgi:hypothetical protein